MGEDCAGGDTETLTMSATPSVSSGRPTGSESISSRQRLSRAYTNSAGQIIQTDEYLSIANLTYSTSTMLGTENTYYYRTRYAYDHSGRLNMTKTSNGTSTSRTHNKQNLTTSIENFTIRHSAPEKSKGQAGRGHFVALLAF